MFPPPRETTYKKVLAMRRKDDARRLIVKVRSKRLKGDNGKDKRNTPLQIRLHPNIDEILAKSVRRGSIQ